MSAKKSKTLNAEQEIEAMKAFIEETFASFGASINFNSDERLQSYTKGKPTRLEDLQKLKKDDIVWLIHKDGNSTRYRGAIRFMDYDSQHKSWTFGDGSSFVTPVYLKDWEEEDKAFYAGDDHRLTFYTAKKK